MTDDFSPSEPKDPPATSDLEGYRRAVGVAIVAGYQRVPETPEELRAAEENLRRLVVEEPW